MFTQHVICTSADGTTVLTPAAQTSAAGGTAFYSTGAVGLIDPNLYFVGGGVGDHGYRLDAVTVQQTVAAAGQVQIVDILSSARILLAPFADLSAVAAVASLTSRSFPMPPGYRIRVNGANVRAIILSYTQTPAIADVQYIAVTVINQA